MTNSERAMQAQQTLVYYADVTNCSDPLPSVVVDLVTDLFHYCDRAGVDTEDLMRVAKMHHETEKKEEENNNG